MPEHDEAEQDANRSRRDREEVDGDDVWDVVIQERPPRLRTRLPRASPVLVDGGRGDDVPMCKPLWRDPRFSGFLERLGLTLPDRQ